MDYYHHASHAANPNSDVIILFQSVSGALHAVEHLNALITLALSLKPDQRKIGHAAITAKIGSIHAMMIRHPYRSFRLGTQNSLRHCSQI